MVTPEEEPPPRLTLQNRRAADWLSWTGVISCVDLLALCDCYNTAAETIKLIWTEQMGAHHQTEWGCNGRSQEMT